MAQNDFNTDRMTTKHPARNGCVILVLFYLAAGGLDFISRVWP